MPLILLLLIGLPLIELYFLIQVGSEIGALPTIGLTIVTAVLGTWLVRVQGFSILARVRETMDRGEVPALEAMDGSMVLLAGLMLLLPGFLTDAVGFLLLVPPFRAWVIRRFARYTTVHVSGHSVEVRRQDVIEGQFKRED